MTTDHRPVVGLPGVDTMERHQAHLIRGHWGKVNREVASFFVGGDMSARRTERLLNLVICLLSTRRYLTKEEIRRSVAGYGEGQEAFERAFERDKEELRELGIPLEIGSNNPLFDDDAGYRIRRDAYALPPIELAADEMAVIGLAARFWQQASLADSSSRALLKLKAGGAGDVRDELVGIEPRLVRSEPGFADLWDAVSRRQAVEFDYRPRRGPRARRHLEPWGIVAWRGRWYVAGHDRDREAERVFRLGRIEGAVARSGAPGAFQVPPDIDLRATVRSFVGDSPPVIARVRLRGESGGGLRRQAAGPAQPDPDHDGWSIVEVPFRDGNTLVEDVLAYGADAVLVDPPEARELVRARLAAVAEPVGVEA